MSALVWVKLPEFGNADVRWQNRRVGFVQKAITGDFSATINAPDLRYQTSFASFEDAAEWIEREWADFVRLLHNTTPAPVGNGGW